MSEIIDVEYTDVVESEPSNSGSSYPALTPEIALIDGFFSTIRTFSNDVRAYKATKEHEKTQRAAINARLKESLAYIESQKDIALEILEKAHNEKMNQLESIHEKNMSYIRGMSKALDAAINIAIEQNDFSEVNTILGVYGDFVKFSVQKDIEALNASNNSFGQATAMLSGGFTPAGSLK